MCQLIIRWRWCIQRPSLLLYCYVCTYGEAESKSTHCVLGHTVLKQYIYYTNSSFILSSCECILYTFKNVFISYMTTIPHFKNWRMCCEHFFKGDSMTTVGVCVDSTCGGDDVCFHYVLYGRRRLTCTWACSYQSPPSVVARRWGRCGGWPRWLSGSRVRPWLPQRERKQASHKDFQDLFPINWEVILGQGRFFCAGTAAVIFFFGILATKRIGISGSAWLIRITIRRCCRSGAIRLAPLC